MTRTSQTRLSMTLLLASVGGPAPALLGAPASPGPMANPLLIAPGSHDFTQNPKLLERITATSHGYFRFINVPFCNEVGRRFREHLAGASAVNLHGDAHVEQYAVTDLGRGLTDFDDTCTGPAILDWVRFGVSLHLACREKGWEGEGDGVVSAFLRAYRSSLENPGLAASEPALVRRFRSSFSTDRGKFLGWAESLMSPVAEDEKTGLAGSMAAYARSILTKSPELSPDFFRVIRVGRLQTGVGSALDLKYLVRVRADSDEPEDDAVLEVKEVRDISGIDCIDTSQKASPLRILQGQARIAYQPFRYLGYFRHEGRPFWVHAWVENYKQVQIAKSLQDVQDLADLAADVGVQLGKGHVKHIASPFDAELRREQMELLSATEASVRTQCAELADRTAAAWARFSESVAAR